MKTAVTVLQEMMTKLGRLPEYECIAQSGPQHLAMFEYRCSAHGVTVTAIARSKKEAKQEAARVMLLQLEEHGLSVPPPFCRGGAPVNSLGAPIGSKTLPGVCSAAGAAAGPLTGHSYVALLRELCDEYRLPAVEYELTADTGPPHARHFTVSARLGMTERRATSTTKKSARQLAAVQLYTYLKENLSRVTKDFVEDEALARAHEKAMDRYVETREELSWRPHLGQRIADYHLGLLMNVEPEKRQTALSTLEATLEEGPESALEAVARVLELTVEWSQLATEQDHITTLTLVPTSPTLTTAGADRGAAVASALRYLRLALTSH